MVVLMFFSERELSSSSLLYAIVDLFVVCLSSVTLVQHRDSSFLMPKFVGGGRPFPPEICVQSDPPPYIAVCARKNSTSLEKILLQSFFV